MTFDSKVVGKHPNSFEVCGSLGPGGKWFESYGELDRDAPTGVAPETAFEETLRERFRRLEQIESWEARSREASLVTRAIEAVRLAAALRKARQVPYDRVVLVQEADIEALVSDPAHNVPYRGSWSKASAWGRGRNVLGEVLIGNATTAELDGRFGAVKRQAREIANELSTLERRSRDEVPEIRTSRRVQAISEANFP